MKMLPEYYHDEDHESAAVVAANEADRRAKELREEIAAQEALNRAERKKQHDELIYAIIAAVSVLVYFFAK